MDYCLEELTSNRTLLDCIKNGTNMTDFEAVAKLQPLYNVSVEVIVLLSVFYGSISVVAVIGNSLVIWIVSTTRKMQTMTNLFIANLALADVIIGMFAIPFQFQAALLQRWDLPEFMCAFCPFAQLVSVNVSVFTLTAIAVDRHRAIINPLRARLPKYVSKLSIFIIWVVSIIFSVPVAYAMQVIQLQSYTIHNSVLIYNKPFCEVHNLDEAFIQNYRYYLVFVQYLIPLGVISFVYIQMAIRLWGSKTPGNAQGTRDKTLLKNKKKVIKMLLIVVFMFAICWFPLQLYNFLHVTFIHINEYRYINIVWFFCDWLAMSNSCYNPFIYGIYNERFRREFCRRFPFLIFGYTYSATPNSEKSMSTYTRAIHYSYSSCSPVEMEDAVNSTHTSPNSIHENEIELDNYKVEINICENYTSLEEEFDRIMLKPWRIKLNHVVNNVPDDWE